MFQHQNCRSETTCHTISYKATSAPQENYSEIPLIRCNPAKSWSKAARRSSFLTCAWSSWLQQDCSLPGLIDLQLRFQKTLCFEVKKWSRMLNLKKEGILIEMPHQAWTLRPSIYFSNASLYSCSLLLWGAMHQWLSGLPCSRVLSSSSSPLQLEFWLPTSSNTQTTLHKNSNHTLSISQTTTVQARLLI